MSQLEDLEEKDWQLRAAAEDAARERRAQLADAVRTRKDAAATRRQLAQERNLKLEAFHRVDDLQAQVRAALFPAWLAL